MRFGPVALDEAVGALLAHTTRLDGGSLKKGTRLSAADLERLRAAGIDTVIAARLDPGDVPEDEAAARVAAALAGGPVTVAEPFTGRANVFAAQRGLALIDTHRLVGLNRIDEGLTVATVADQEAVTEGQMLATVKIIPFALPGAVVERALALCGEAGPILSMAPFRAMGAGLVLTRFAWTADKLLAKRRQAVADRLEAAGSRLAAVEACAHDAEAVAAAVRRLAAAGAAPILVFGAAAIADRHDVIPLGVSGAGGEVLHVGMPVDPGNLLMVGRLGGADVIGVPSCAGSPQFNGFDKVLARSLAGLAIGWDAIAAMAPGGLLKEVAARPQPRQAKPTPRTERRIAGLVLAAGRSTRLAPRNKLVESLGEEAVVRHTVKAVLASRARPVIVVTGHDAERVAAALSGLDVILVHNHAFAEGLSTSLRAGLDALPPDADGVLVCLGDMPTVGARDIDRLIAAFDPAEGRAICVPVRDGKRGNPVLWAAALIPEMKQVRGDTGAKHLIGAHEDVLVEVPFDTRAIFDDIDTPDDLARLRAG